jgi:hypothetical protein
VLTRHPVLSAVIVFIGVAVGMNVLVGPATCRDGWRSHSIGRQGACSWHGGVDRSRGSLVLFASVIAAGATFMWCSSRLEKHWHKDRVKRGLVPDRVDTRPEASRKPTAELTSELGPCCPKCGSSMRKRIARKGKRRGSSFWGCKRYPACHGTLSI